MKYLKTTPGAAIWMKLQTFKNDIWYEFNSRFVTVYTDRVGPDGKPIVQKRNIISNSHNGEKNVPCVLYYYCIEDDNQDLWAGQQFAASVVVLENYHEIPKKSKAGKTYKVMVPCRGKNRYGNSQCQSCDSNQPLIYGQQHYWSVWPSIKKDFTEQLAGLPTRCISCKDGEVSTFGYSCNACGEKIASMYDDPNNPITEEDIAKYENEEVTCGSCSHVGKADRMTECIRHLGDDKYEDGCKEPKTLPAGTMPEDCEIRVKFEKVGNATKVSIVDFRLHDPETLSEDLRSPMDLQYTLGWMDLSDQAKSMGKVNPFAEDAQKELEAFFTAKPGEDDNDSVSW